VPVEIRKRIEVRATDDAVVLVRVSQGILHDGVVAD
jgi:hypothetical protein